MSGLDSHSDLPPPHYDWSQHDYDSKVATATERSLHQSFAPVSGPSRSFDEDEFGNEFETWTDEKFEAAARAFEARQTKRMMGMPQPGASGSGSGSTSDRRYTPSSSSAQNDISGPQTNPLDRSQTPRPFDYVQTQPHSPAPAPIPTSAPSMAPHRLVSPPSSAMSNGREPVAPIGGLQRGVSLFRTSTILQHDHGEQLPAFTDVALPEEIVPENMAPMASTSSPPSPPTAPQSPPPPHTFSPPPGPPPPPLRNVRSPPPPPLNAHRPLPPSTPAPASPTHNEPPPAFMPSNNHHHPILEKTNPYAHLHLENARVMSKPMSVYASAKMTHTPPSIRFDLETAYGRRESPGPDTPKASSAGASFYSSAVSSTMSGRPLPKPGGARARTTIPLEPSPRTMGGQPGTYGAPNQTGPYASQYQQPHQPEGFYTQPVQQQPYYGQNQPSQQGTHWGGQYPNHGVTTPPPGGQGQPGWGASPPAAPWPGNGGYYR